MFASRNQQTLLFTGEDHIDVRVVLETYQRCILLLKWEQRACAPWRFPVCDAEIWGQKEGTIEPVLSVPGGACWPASPTANLVDGRRGLWGGLLGKGDVRLEPGPVTPAGVEVLWGFIQAWLEWKRKKSTS